MVYDKKKNRTSIEWASCIPLVESKREGKMKLNLKSLTLTAGILWALAVFLVGVLNLFWPGYGVAFLQLIASIYPGYHATSSVGDLVVGTLYALVDGAICGLVFGGLYNLFVGKASTA
jgi:hypothetical protein